MEPSVQYLREFRDDVLLSGRARRLFGPLFGVYYRVGPAVARAMVRHPSLKRVVRVGLIAPLVRAVELGERLGAFVVGNGERS